jgi:NADPH2 dehydrogenase
MTKLFEATQIRNMKLKNRVMMAPMCMYEALEDGIVRPFHLVHYGSRAVGQVGLIIVEATGVLPEGRITENDLGIWDDQHIDGLTKLVAIMHSYGSKTAIQLAHAGRKSTCQTTPVAPSAIAFDEKYRTPKELTIEEITHVVDAFKKAAERAITAGFDALEIHAAHGYLLNEFLSPLTNKRTDTYGGNAENRYRILREVIDQIRSIWDGPLFVRISAEDYHKDGLTTEDYVQYTRWMQSQQVDLIDVSTGAVVPAQIDAFPLYQVPYAAKIREETSILTGAVGLITTGEQCEQILQKGDADYILIGRELLRDPYFVHRVAKQLDVALEAPTGSYARAW